MKSDVVSLLYNKEVSFKRFLIELSSLYSTLVDNEKKRRSARS